MPIDIDPELPWGYWLNFVERPSGAVFIDEHGQEWATVRQAFWCGRLHMPLQNGEPPADQLELLHAVLADRARLVCLGKSGPFLKRAREGIWNGEWHGTSAVYAGADHREAA